MHSHLAIIGKNGELTLKPDDSLTVTDKNPMFNEEYGRRKLYHEGSRGR